MTINLFTFPLNNQSVFIYEEQKVSGQDWAKECLALAHKINNYDERNWLLYEDDFYQYSQYFFALLLANKNIVLAQSDQLERLRQAAKFAEISIGGVDPDNNKQTQFLPHFLPHKNCRQSSEKLALPQDSIAINANTCITLFTSGSTGEAKAIKKYWYQLANEVEALQSLFPYEHMCVLSTVTHQHIYGLLFKLIWPVFTDKEILCETIEYPEQVEHYCRNFNNTILISSPSYLSRADKQLSSHAIASIKKVFCSGGALSANVANDFLQSNQKTITEIYGSTETGGIAWRQQVNNPLWQLFPEHQATVAEDNTLVLASNFLPKNEKFKTDDRVELKGRFFSLLGRVDRIIKLHEKRLSLDEMEKELSHLHKVSACHCFVLDNAKSKAALVTVIELEKHCQLPDNTEQKKQLVNECKKALLSVFEPSLLPRKWRFVQQLPFNSQGKLVKAELVNLFNKSNTLNE
ncbi:MAG: AMP-binding protein [Colwellia sp.]|nr:AMP-binding protein [Colwellia sp.]MCW8864261.1 AMP-binding protein [Colwellia sp.]MCW9082400.1 AMP-binding protein [Colwellia sp.]